MPAVMAFTAFVLDFDSLGNQLGLIDFGTVAPLEPFFEVEFVRLYLGMSFSVLLISMASIVQAFHRFRRKDEHSRRFEPDSRWRNPLQTILPGCHLER